MPGKCTFKEAWLSNHQFTIWIERGKSSGQARCKVCSKDFDIQNMGEEESLGRNGVKTCFYGRPLKQLHFAAIHG